MICGIRGRKSKMMYLSLVVDKWVSLGHYDLLVKYSTSMQQIYYMLHNYYDKINESFFQPS